VKEGEAGAL
jgi:hypothetical protein